MHTSEFVKLRPVTSGDEIGPCTAGRDAPSWRIHIVTCPQKWLQSPGECFLSVCFFLWDLSKGEVYRNKPYTFFDLETFARKLQPFLHTCHNVYSPVWSFAFRCLWTPGVTAFSTLCSGTQYHKDWGMHYKTWSHQFINCRVIAENLRPLVSGSPCINTIVSLTAYTKA
jgi:hypothetical protein